MITCNTSTLTPYVPSSEKEWNEMRVKHLYRRLGFGASVPMIKSALERNPSELIDELIDEAINKPVMEDPGWGYLDTTELYAKFPDYAIGTYKNVITKHVYENFFFGGLRDRLFLFWSNHFVAGFHNNKRYVPYLYQQTVMRQRNAIGNLKTFVQEMGLNPLMHYYLNGIQNEKQAPNENFARELYELFTLGVDNGYTEQDIVETARALTGYTETATTNGEIILVENNFDATDKTIFGRTGNWGYNDVIDILFEEKGYQVAQYICRKFYKYFISFDTVDETIVNALADTMVSNNFEIAPVMRQLFKSEHFFDEASIGTIIKSPLDLVVGYQNELNTIYHPDNETPQFKRASDIAGYYLEQDVFDPPNVAGWPGDTNWISSVSFPERWMRMSHITIYQYWDARDFKSDPYKPFLDLALCFFEPNENDAIKISKRIIDFFLCKPLSSSEDYLDGIASFKGNVPDNYFEDGTWDLNYQTAGKQVYDLLKNTIINLPEFQIK